MWSYNFKEKSFKIQIFSFWSIIWILGIVIAKGFWSTFFAIFVYPWSFYLVVEFFATKYLF